MGTPQQTLFQCFPRLTAGADGEGGSSDKTALHLIFHGTDAVHRLYGKSWLQSTRRPSRRARASADARQRTLVCVFPRFLLPSTSGMVPRGVGAMPMAAKSKFMESELEGIHGYRTQGKKPKDILTLVNRARASLRCMASLPARSIAETAREGGGHPSNRRVPPLSVGIPTQPGRGGAPFDSKGAPPPSYLDLHTKIRGGHPSILKGKEEFFSS